MSARTTRSSKRSPFSAAETFNTTFRVIHYSSLATCCTMNSEDLNYHTRVFVDQLRAVLMGEPEGTYIAIDPDQYSNTIPVLTAIRLLGFTPYIAIPDEKLETFGVKWFLTPKGRERIFSGYVKIQQVAEISDRTWDTSWVLNKAVEGRRTSRKTRSNKPTIYSYAIRTSGTTGASKLVNVPQLAIEANVNDFINKFNINPEDGILIMSPLTFDPTLCDIFVAMNAGCAVITMSESLRQQDPCGAGAKILVDQKVTYMFVTPSVLFRLGETTLLPAVQEAATKGTFRVLLLGGEPITPSAGKILMELIKNARIAHEKRIAMRSRPISDVGSKLQVYNVYGLTELSCWATVREITPSLPLNTLGEPLTGIELQRVNLSKEHPAEDFQVHELVLGYAGGSRGCLILNSDGSRQISSEPRLHTGDLFRTMVLPDGSQVLVYYGRKDSMVKLYGHRVQLKLVDRTVAEYLSISPAKVCSFIQDHSIVCCIVWKLDEKGSAALLKAGIRQAIADECDQPSVPAVIVFINSLPLSTNGKVDLKELLSMVKLRSSQNISDTLLGIVRECLPLGDSWSDSDILKNSFRFLGGNSLIAANVRTELELCLRLEAPRAMDFLLQPEKPLHALLDHLEQGAPNQRTSEGGVEEEGLKTLEREAAEEYKIYLKRRKRLVETLPEDLAECFHGFVVDTATPGRGPEERGPSRDRIDVPLSLFPYQCHGMRNFDDLEKPVISKKPIIEAVGTPVDAGSCVDLDLALVMSCDKRVLAAGHHGRLVYTPVEKLGLDYAGEIMSLPQPKNSPPVFTGSPLVFRWDWAEESNRETMAVVTCDSHGNVVCQDPFGPSEKIFWTWKGGKDKHPRNSPVVVYVNGVPRVIFGCDDNYLRGIDGRTGWVVFQTNLRGLPMRGPPAVARTMDLVYCTTSNLKLIAISPDSGVIRWVYSAHEERLILTAPTCHQGVVVCATDGGWLFGVLGSNGTRLWRVRLPPIVDGSDEMEKAVSSPMITPAGPSEKSARHIVLGTVRGSVVCYRIHASMRLKPVLLWKQTLSAVQIFANPCWWDVFIQPDQEAADKYDAMLYVVCSSDGILHLLDSVSGEKLADYRFSEKVFSTPVMAGNKIFVGCRDDYVHRLAVK